MPHAPFDVMLLPGIRQDVDPLVAPKGTLADAVNVRFGRVGGVYPRYGTRTIPPTRSTTDGASIQSSAQDIGVIARVRDAGIVGLAGDLFAWNNARSVFDYFGAYSTALPSKTRLGLIFSGVPSAPDGGTLGASRYGIAVSTNGHILLAAGHASGAASGSTGQYQIETAEGARAFVGASAGNGPCACLAVGNTFYLVTQNSTTLTAHPITVSGQLVSLGTRATVGTLTSASAHWDITPAPDGVHWYLVHQSGGTTLRVDRFAGTVSNANNTITVAGTSPCSLYADSTDVWVGWHNDPTVTGEVRYRTLATNLGSFRSAVTTIATGTTFGPPLFGPYAPSPSSLTAYLVFRHSNESSSPYTVSARWSTATSPNNSGTTGTVGTVKISWHVVPISKPDSGGRFWAVTGNQATNWTTQRAVLLSMAPINGQEDATLELSTEQTLLPHASRMASTIVGMFHHVAEGSDGKRYFALPKLLQRAQASSLADLIHVDSVEYTVSTSVPHRCVAELGASTVICGQPVEVFGSGYPARDALGFTPSAKLGSSPVGFAYPPAVLTATQQAGGDLSALGTYVWTFVYQWVDVYGRRHLSAPSAPYTLTLTAGNNSVIFQVTGLSWDQRQSELTSGMPARLLAFRTIVVNGSMSTTLYRETEPSMAPQAVSLTTGQVQWTSGASTLAHSDSEIATNEILYTDGGVKDNTLAPSCVFSVESETRLWLGGGWDSTLIQASKIRVPSEPVTFTDDPSFQVHLPDPCTGLAYQDGSVIAFAKRAVYVVTGEGPNDQGVGQFSEPRAICRDIGCEDYRSILETAQGILFKSKRGFYLLPRGNGVPVFVGAAVQRFTDPNGDAYSTILGAVTVSDSRYRTAQFLVQQSDGDTVRLVYDLDIAANDPLNGWSYDTFSNDLAAIGPWPNGVLLAKADLSSASLMGYYDECDSTYDTDASNTENITSAVQTTQIRVGGLAGEFRCLTAQVLLSNADGGALTVGLYLDDLAAETGGSPWTLSSTTGSIYRQVSAGQVADVSSFSVRMSVARTAVLGPTFHGFTADVQAEGDIRRTDSTER